MHNFSKAAFLRVGKILASESGGTPLGSLVAWSGIPRKSLYNWTLAKSDPQYRTMPPVAKRMLGVLAFLALSGQISKQCLAQIEALEALMENEEKFAQITRVLALKMAVGADEPGDLINPVDPLKELRGKELRGKPLRGKEARRYDEVRKAAVEIRKAAIDKAAIDKATVSEAAVDEVA